MWGACRISFRNLQEKTWLQKSRVSVPIGDNKNYIYVQYIIYMYELYIYNMYELYIMLAAFLVIPTC